MFPAFSTMIRGAQYAKAYPAVFVPALLTSYSAWVLIELINDALGKVVTDLADPTLSVGVKMAKLKKVDEQFRQCRELLKGQAATDDEPVLAEDGQADGQEQQASTQETEQPSTQE